MDADHLTPKSTAEGQSPRQLKREYSLRFAHSAPYRTAVWRLLCDSFFGHYVSPSMSILDLGCGWGEFVNNVSAKTRHAIDLNPDSRRHLSDEVHFIHQDCSEPWPLESESLDLVFTSNFLEHLPSKKQIERTVAEAFRCLKPGGRILCLGPNVRYLPGAHWDFWDHYVPLTDMSLAELLRLTGFSVESRIPRFLPFSMSLGFTPPLWSIWLYLKLPFVWPLFGKQFFVVGTKEP